MSAPKRSVVTVSAAIAAGIALMSAGLPGYADADADAVAAAGHGRGASGASISKTIVTLINPGSGLVTAQVSVSAAAYQVFTPPSGDAAYVTGFGPSSLVAYKITPGRTARATRLAANPAATLLSLSPNGKTLFEALGSKLTKHGFVGKIVPISTSSRRSGRPIELHGKWAQIDGLAVAPNEKVMYVAIGQGAATIEPIRISTGKAAGRPIAVGRRGLFTPQMTYSRSGGRLFLLSSGERYSLITVINTRTGRKIGYARIPGGVATNGENLAVTPNGKLAYVVSFEALPGQVLNFVSVLHIGAKVSMIKTLDVDGAMAVATAPSGRAAYVAGTDYATDGFGQMTAISSATNEPSSPITVGEDTALSLGVSPDGATAYVEESNDAVFPVDLKAGTVGVPIAVGPQPGYFLGDGGMAFTSSGRILYVLATPTE
jgi:hypothetical protein